MSKGKAATEGPSAIRRDAARRAGRAGRGLLERRVREGVVCSPT